MKAYEQQRNDYNKLLSTLGQKLIMKKKQFDFDVVQPFIQSAEQAKALIAAGEQNETMHLKIRPGYATSAFSGMAGKVVEMYGGSKVEISFKLDKLITRATPSRGMSYQRIQNDVKIPQAKC